MKSFILTLVFLAFGYAGFAQEPNWPEDKAKASEKYTLFVDAVKAKNYSDATVEAFRWLYKEAPNLHKSLYQNGTKIYEFLEANEKDTKRKVELQDTILQLYDNRIKYFNEEAAVLNFKGLKAYPFLVNRSKNTDELFTLYDKIFSMNGKTTFLANTTFFMDVLCKRKAEGKINDEQIIEEYEKIIEVLEENIANGKNTAAAEQTKTAVEDKLSSCVKVDCDFVEKNLGPKFKANPTDLKLAKKIFALMISGKCTSSPLFLEANEAIIKVEPSYGGYKIQGVLYKAAKDWSKVIEYFEKAAEMAPGEKEKAAAYMEIAAAHYRRGVNESARASARKAIATSSTVASEGYELIGDLYFTSGGECKGENPVLSRAIYLAAYEMYEKSGVRAKMNQAEAQFPSAEEIFTHNYSEGQTISTGCWIGETVKIKKRK